MNPTRCHTIVTTPLGPLTLVAEDDRLSGVYFEDQRHAPHPERLGPYRPGGLPERLASLTDQLEAYFAGELTTFDVELAPSGTAFQLRVWEALSEIPYGETRSYGDIARRVGQAGAARAVGLANGRNPIGLIVPCHRVIGTDGSLTGYGGGVERKRALLALEAGAGRLFAV